MGKRESTVQRTVIEQISNIEDVLNLLFSKKEERKIYFDKVPREVSMFAAERATNLTLLPSLWNCLTFGSIDCL